ncbi:prolyl oligopeptidase family serine peptidase [Pseudoduganella eburnea]|uniref:Prolyl oligopeptidase family serine peptidase n=1 Tax=Massilia eburnea TaxID=1776165 RepID=A0A6L6QHK0_9BURK|nr:alpha/beta fold hydrolase [Massilia eburnea]MTW11695.1 prolyl oligopeptidase family serine peptidase [Massilia eburnea]
MIKYLLAGLATVAGLADAAPPAQHFFESPHYKEVMISPSGRYLALRVGDNEARDSLAVVDTETLQIVSGKRVNNYDIGNIRWVNDERLVYSVLDNRTKWGDWNYAPGLYAFSRDGKETRQLVDHEWAKSDLGTLIKSRLEPWNTYLMEQDGGQDSNFIYLRRLIWTKKAGYDLERTELIKLDTVNGQSSTLSHPGTAQGWMLDAKGIPAIMVSSKDNVETIHYRNASGEWRDVATQTAYGVNEEGISPIGFYDDKRLLVMTRTSGDKAALYLMDLATGKVDPEPLVALADFDFNGGVVYSNNRMVGIHYQADAWSSAWFDPALQAAQKEVDRKLTGLINIITPPTHPETSWMLVASYSDRQPIFYSLYNSKTHEIKGIGGRHPDIKASEMGRQDMIKYRARDGMDIPAWLTMPAKGGKKLPMVVLVHGGPYVRGNSWGWDVAGQFLASRGYVVLEPEFRGTTGYGFKLFKAGLKQWGLKMQDDIADSVKWAVDKGIADPDRVCIMGASYGGYATLMGLVNDPGLYRCGIAYAAVTDIPLLYDSGMAVLSEVSPDYKTYGMPTLVGEPEKDAAQFDATSPLKQAARIKRPLLLAHGTDDIRVPYPHFIKMRSALQEAKANVEFVEYVGEGHEWSTLKTRLDFWGRVEKFLDKNIGQNAHQ